MLYSRAVCSRPCDSYAAFVRKSASRFPLATMNAPFHGLPLLSPSIAPPPATIACCGFIPPSSAAITGSLTASAVSVAGAPSNRRATIVANIST